MSTRALIIRKTASGMLEYGQSKKDGDRNTDKLNKHYCTPALVDELFSRMSKNGISTLGSTFESTDWKDEAYFYGIEKPFAVTPESMRAWLDKFDFPEFASVWDGAVWRDFSLSGEAFLFRACIAILTAPAPTAQEAPPDKPRFDVSLSLTIEAANYADAALRVQKVIDMLGAECRGLDMNKALPF